MDFLIVLFRNYYMIKSGIYTIFSKSKLERFYIGSTVNLNERKIKHFSDLRKIKHRNSKLQRHFNKYGEQDLVFEVIEYVEDKTKLIEREQYFIDEYHPYFNICKIAGNTLGTKRSKEFCEKQSKQRKGQKVSEETKLKISLSSKGINTWAKGNTNRKGKKHSEETKLKMSLAKKGKPCSEQQRLNLLISINNKKKSILQFDLDGNFIREWESSREIERQTGFIHNYILYVIKGIYKTAYGFIWVYKSDYVNL